MRVAMVWLIGVLACGGGIASAQSADEAALKSVLQAETKAWIDRNPDAWQATWLQDETATRVIVQAGAYTSQKGWAAISAPMLKDFKENPTPLPFAASIDNFAVRQEGNLAFVEYDQTSKGADGTASGAPSREFRALRKNGGKWQIASQVTHVVNSFGDTPGALAGRINGVGQSLLRAGKQQEAIEILKMNTLLSPQSAAAFVSLGEAYALARQKDLAVQNYQRALKLNPEDEDARKALARLGSSK